MGLAADTPRQPAGADQAGVVVLDARVVRGSGGGPDKTILNSPRHLSSAGYRNLCVYLRPPRDRGFERLRRKAEQRNVSLIEIDDRGPLDGMVVPRLLNLCRRERVRIWHAHDYKTNLLGLLLSRLWPMRLITTVHGWGVHGPRLPFYYWLDRLSLQHYEKVICVSKDLHDGCLRLGVAPDRCELIENGIDDEEYARDRTVAEAKRHLSLDSTRFLIGGAGRLSPEKGFDLLIRAVHELRRAGTDASLVIIGEGDQRAALQALIVQLGQQEYIRLLGYRSDMRDWLQAMDVFALSSLREGLPNVLLEAMALETPVVATRIAGIPRLVQNGENGVLVDAADIEGLAYALKQLADDSEHRIALGQTGRTTVRSRFSFAERMRKVKTIYDRLLCKAGNGHSSRKAETVEPSLFGISLRLT
jgi:glycosyltransferase involved in cell wall biosynthesis